MSYAIENALFEWEEGEDNARRSGELDRAARIVVTELRRRLGGSFTLDELADLYDEGTGWCTDLAVEEAPDEPFAWDARVVADAAFGRYSRSARDFAGGRRIS